jgi:predicted transposase/invertase (TIGR01784 family)
MKELIKEILINIPDYEENVMTYGDELRKEGEQKGKQEAQQEIVKNLLKSGIDTSIVAKATHLTAKQLDKTKKH